MRRLILVFALIALAIPVSWTLGYLLFWVIIQRVGVDFSFFWDWLVMVLEGRAGEAPATVAALSELVFVVLVVAVILATRHRGRTPGNVRGRRLN